MKELDKKIISLRNALFNSWSIETSSKWIEQNPAKGQCSVTALVVNNLLYGQIIKTKVEESWHYYNYIHGKRYDFTESQFGTSIQYDDLLSSRSEAFLDTNETQYRTLKDSVLKKINFDNQ